jgi:cell division transport system permease protein
VIVFLVTAAVIVVAARSGLAARRETILIVCQLGASDGYIARRFANRVSALAFIGGAIGGSIALPVVFALTTLAASLAGRGTTDWTFAYALSRMRLWQLPLILPVMAAIIAYFTAHITLRQWLRQLP